MGSGVETALGLRRLLRRLDLDLWRALWESYGDVSLVLHGLKGGLFMRPSPLLANSLTG